VLLDFSARVGVVGDSKLIYCSVGGGVGGTSVKKELTSQGRTQRARASPIEILL